MKFTCCWLPFIIHKWNHRRRFYTKKLSITLPKDNTLGSQKPQECRCNRCRQNYSLNIARLMKWSILPQPMGFDNLTYHSLLTESLVDIYSILVEIQLWQPNAWNKNTNTLEQLLEEIRPVGFRTATSNSICRLCYCAIVTCLYHNLSISS